MTRMLTKTRPTDDYGIMRVNESALDSKCSGESVKCLDQRSDQI